MLAVADIRIYFRVYVCNVFPFILYHVPLPPPPPQDSFLSRP